MSGTGTRPAPPDGQTAWLSFAGSVERQGAILRLTAEDGNGFLEMGGGDVGRDAGGRLFVRKGAIVSHISEPALRDATARPSPEAVAGDCPTGITCCVGSVLVCCGDHRVIGSCRGAWGCERHFMP